jgi:hypothetical protein
VPGGERVAALAQVVEHAAEQLERLLPPVVALGPVRQVRQPQHVTAERPHPDARLPRDLQLDEPRVEHRQRQRPQRPEAVLALAGHQRLDRERRPGVLVHHHHRPGGPQRDRDRGERHVALDRVGLEPGVVEHDVAAVGPGERLELGAEVGGLEADVRGLGRHRGIDRDQLDDVPAPAGQAEADRPVKLGGVGGIQLGRSGGQFRVDGAQCRGQPGLVERQRAGEQHL